MDAAPVSEQKIGEWQIAHGVELTLEQFQALREALTTIEKEAYRRGVLAALEKVPEELECRSLHSPSTCTDCGYNDCREEAIKNIKGLLE